VVLIHTDASAGYPWQVVRTSWSGEQIALPLAAPARTEVQMWVTEEAARRVAALGGADLDALRRRAERRDFAPVPLGVTLSVALENRVRRAETANVLGVLPGSDPALAGEMVVVTAHHDHLGAGEGPGDGDRIHNGALDNASGVGSMLALAEAVARHARPRRSILFAAVGAEESGLLGSEYLAANPPVPPGKLVAGFNLDGMNIWGRTRDVEIPGLGKTTLDAVVAPLARAQGRRLVPDQEPDRGAFYRSDHFSLAKIGVPALSFGGGQDYVGRPAGWGKAQQDAWVAQRYHQPSDEVDASWNLDGMVEDIQLVAAALLRVADRREPPRWTPGDEFEAAWMKARQAGSSRPSRP
jgi:Zn-dependent M28 family amino/carboxypeptidase